MRSKYSKTRLMLSLLLIIPCVYVAIVSYQLPNEYINLLPVTLFSIGSIMFIFNKLWADIITFFSFLFLIINGVMLIILDFKNCREDIEPSCVIYILEQFKLDLAILFPTFIFMILVYLLLEFYKRKYRVYK
jgi:hypothetical protein